MEKKKAKEIGETLSIQEPLHSFQGNFKIKDIVIEDDLN